MIETLYVNGCSWTSGNELEIDEKYLKFIESLGLRFINEKGFDLFDGDGNCVCSASDYWNKFNWGFYLSQSLGSLNYINGSRGGSSNDRIVRTTVDFIMKLPEEKRKSLLVVIGWTISSRREFYIKELKDYERFNTHEIFSKSVPDIFKISEEQKKRYDLFHSLYLENFHDNTESINRYTNQVYLLANLLDNLGVNYLFFDAIDQSGGIIYYQKEEDFSDFLNWQRNNKRIISDLSMMNFNYLNGYKTGPGLHPLSEGHEAWAKFLFEKIKNRLIVNGR